ncbi:MAG: xanthine dehydrogenase family protein molybdopterin-binding subunit, partial [Dehalococcoidia bacterium]|nr:xanthine dehydrogenase family protein molybdopterin-binding subunit [Dehalococcoidia bacterium]
IKRIDTSKAEALPGVMAVVTAADCPDVRAGWSLKDIQVFARDKVRWLGEPVAAVAAVDEDTADKALGLIDVDYEELPAVFDPEEAAQPGAPLVHEGVEGYVGYTGGLAKGYSKNVVDYSHAHKGDIEKGFKDADFVFEDAFRTCRQSPCAMETQRVIAEVEPFSGQVRVWASSQLSGGLRSSIAELLRLPMAKVSVRWSYVGGGFGGKTEPELAPKAVLLAAKARRPVKIVLPRREDFTVCCRPPGVMYLKTGVKKDGRIVAREVKCFLDVGAYGALGIMVSRVIAERTGAVYDIPNVSATAYAVYTNNIRAGAVRGFGQPEISFPSEAQIDMIAERLGMDPLELRLQNAVEEGDTTNAGRVLRSVSLKQCIEAVAEKADWKAKRANKVAGRGLGLGCTMALAGGHSTAGAVKVNEDGSVAVITGVVEIGQGAHTALAQIAAEELGVPMESVKIVFGDTDFAPFEVGAFAHRGVTLGGSAVKEASREAKAVMLRAASELLEASPEDLEIKGGLVYVRGASGRAIPFREVAAFCHYAKGTPPMGHGVGRSLRPVDPKSIEGGAYGPIHSQSFAVAAAEVEVDRETGVVKVLRVTESADCGLAINPLAIEGQNDGSACMGASYVLSEEMQIEEGKGTNLELSEYLIPTAVEAPRADTVIVEVPEADGPFGAKGLSDGQSGAVVAAIANAISDAVGARVKQLPITPERILAALRQKESLSPGPGGSGGLPRITEEVYPHA